MSNRTFARAVEGIPRRTKKGRQLNVRVDEKLYERFAAACQQTGVTHTDVIDTLLREFCEYVEQQDGK